MYEDEITQKPAPDYSISQELDESNLLLIRIDSGRFSGTIYSYGDMVGFETDGTPKFKVKVKQLVVNGVATVSLCMTDNVSFQQDVLTPVLLEMMDLLEKAKEQTPEEPLIQIAK